MNKHEWEAREVNSTTTSELELNVLSVDIFSQTLKAGETGRENKTRKKKYFDDIKGETEKKENFVALKPEVVLSNSFGYIRVKPPTQLAGHGKWVRARSIRFCNYYVEALGNSSDQTFMVKVIWVRRRYLIIKFVRAQLVVKKTLQLRGKPTAWTVEEAKKQFGIYLNSRLKRQWTLPSCKSFIPFMIFLAHFRASARLVKHFARTFLLIHYFSLPSRAEENETSWRTVSTARERYNLNSDIIQTFVLWFPPEKIYLKEISFTFVPNFWENPWKLLQKNNFVQFLIPSSFKRSIRKVAKQNKILLISFVDFGSWSTRVKFSFYFFSLFSISEVCKHRSFVWFDVKLWLLNYKIIWFNCTGH